MKRSEIVEEITYILDREAEDLCYPFLAELILTTLENKGMLPPPNNYIDVFGDFVETTEWDENIIKSNWDEE